MANQGYFPGNGSSKADGSAAIPAHWQSFAADNKTARAMPGRFASQIFR
jgi:hypothetical protein